MSGPVHPDWDRDGANWPHRDSSLFEEIGPIRWHFQRMGTGPVLLLLHGAGAATHSWRGLMPILAESFDVVAPDLPGHGFTRIASRSQCSLPAMSQAVAALMDRLGTAPQIILGHSAGAAIGLNCVLSRLLTPDMVIGLNAALTPFRGIAGVLFPPLARMLALNPVVPWMFSQFAGSDGQARRLLDSTGSTLDAEGYALYGQLFQRPRHVDGALAMMALWELDPLLAALPEVNIPIHLMVGAKDTTVPPAEALALAARHGRITAHEVPALGHLMHEEDPRRIAARIREIVAA
ncbi:MAG: alpha/beta fold hydrolase BchO [Pseudomonadota bacterium]